MKKKRCSHWWGIALAAMVVAASARAQYGYSNISIDYTGTVYGSTVTELPYYDSLNGIWAIAYAYLYDPAGSQVASQGGWDDGVGHAEADVSAMPVCSLQGFYDAIIPLRCHHSFTMPSFLYDAIIPLRCHHSFTMPSFQRLPSRKQRLRGAPFVLEAETEQSCT
jgi:hypothetical protein